MMKISSSPLLLAIVAVLSWSTVAAAFKIALTQMTPYQMVVVAATVALLVFATWLTIIRGWGELLTLTPALWARFALLGMISPVAYYLALFACYDYLPAQVAQPVNYIWPIMLTVMQAVIGHKRVESLKYIGMAVSLFGVTAISLGGQALPQGVSAIGLMFGLGSAALWAIYWIVNDSLAGRVSEGASLFLTFMFGVVYLAIGCLFHPMSNPGWSALGAGAYIGAFEMGIPFICFGIALRRSDNPALINQMCYLAPFMSLFLISVVLGEPIMPSTCVGLVLIVGGIVFNQYFAARSKTIKA